MAPQLQDPQSIIDSCIKIIGKGDPDSDWRIEPTQHAEQFEEKAPDFAAKLRRGRPEGLAKIYEDLNTKATEARDEYKRTLQRANFTIMITASLAALLLVAGGLQEPLEAAGPWVVGTIGVFGVISGGLATMWLNQVRGGKLNKRWADERAKAEAKRLAYFKAIMLEVSNEPFEQLLALEYTRRFLLDNQIDYFRDRSEEHRNAADKAFKTSTQAVFISSTFTAIAGLLSMIIPFLAVIAGLSAIASAYSAYILAKTDMNNDRKNAERYRVAEDQLRELRLDIDDYREKAAAGATDAVQKFFEPVYILLEADHKAFLSDDDKRGLAIGEMEKRLDTARKSIDSHSESADKQ